MDPLSITSASVALAAAVYKCAIELKRIAGTMNDAPDSLNDLAEEVQLIQGALRGVEDALEDDKDAITRYKVEDVFSIAVKGCRATLACIKVEFEVLFGRSDWKARFMVLWKEDDMKKLLGRLDRKRASILLLVQLLNLRSVRAVQSLVSYNQASLAVAKEDITALVPTYWSCRDTILDSLDKETVDSIYGDRESRLSTTEFDFDYELINTKTYRRALAKVQVTSRSRRSSSQNKGDPSLRTDMRDPADVLTRVAEEESEQPVEDLIDLSWEPEVRTPQVPSRAYPELEGLDFAPVATVAAEKPTDAREPIVCRTPSPASPTASQSWTRQSRWPLPPKIEGRTFAVHRKPLPLSVPEPSDEQPIHVPITSGGRDPRPILQENAVREAHEARLSAYRETEHGVSPKGPTSDQLPLNESSLPHRQRESLNEESQHFHSHFIRHFDESVSRNPSSQAQSRSGIQGPSMMTMEIQMQRPAREAELKVARGMEQASRQLDEPPTTEEIVEEVLSDRSSSLDTTAGVYGDLETNPWLAARPPGGVKLRGNLRDRQRAERADERSRPRLERTSQSSGQILRQAAEAARQQDKQPDTQVDEPSGDSSPWDNVASSDCDRVTAGNTPEQRSPKYTGSRGRKSDRKRQTKVGQGAQSDQSVPGNQSRQGDIERVRINNPQLLETVEEAIRRLIIPELSALKREQERRRGRGSALTSTGTSTPLLVEHPRGNTINNSFLDSPVPKDSGATKAYKKA